MIDSKRLLWGFLLLAATVASCTDDAPTKAQKVHATSPPDKAGFTVLVVGDSLSAGYGMESEQGWVHLLRKQLGDKAKVVNASISGDTTSGGLARLPRTLAEHQPDIVIIELGGNDGLRGYPVAQIHANLLAMTQAVIAAGATPVLAGMQIPPNYGPRYTAAFRAIYADVAETTGAALVPFLLEGVVTRRELMQHDGIHPTAQAQWRLLNNAWRVLAPLVEGLE